MKVDFDLSASVGFLSYLSSVHIIMAPHIKKNNLFLLRVQHEGDSVTASDADTCEVGKFPFQLVELEMRLERIFFKILQDFSKSDFQIGMFLEKFPSRPAEMGSPD